MLAVNIGRSNARTIRPTTETYAASRAKAIDTESQAGPGAPCTRIRHAPAAPARPIPVSAVSGCAGAVDRRVRADLVGDRRHHRAGAGPGVAGAGVLPLLLARRVRPKTRNRV